MVGIWNYLNFMPLHNPEEMEYKKDNFLYLFFIDVLAFWAMLKYVFLHIVLRLDSEKIRCKFYGSLWIDFFSKVNRGIRLNATNWRAMDELYNYYERIEAYKGVEKFLSKYWMGMENAQAIRNRAKIVKKILEKTIKKQLHIGDKKIKILSIASGSAQPLLETIAGLDQVEQNKIEITLLDRDETAIEHSKVLAEKYNISSNIIMVNKATTYLEETFSKSTFNIIEMIGFLDYRPHEKAIDLMRRIKGLLKKDGVFITCNVCPNKEKFFLDWVLLWPMIYRNEGQFKEVLRKSGFDLDNIQIIFEPHRVHQLAICYNSK